MEIEKGFYYHYKHDTQGAVNNYAYEVMGIGHHTEIEGLEPSAMVLYRPLYESAPVYILENTGTSVRVQCLLKMY